MYQELSGSLNHLSVFTRRDIALAISKLSKFNANLTTTHFKAALHALRYLISTRNCCIVYGRSSTVPITYILGQQRGRQKVLHRLFIVNGGAITWSTHKQHTVAFSSKAIARNNSSKNYKSNGARDLCLPNIAKHIDVRYHDCAIHTDYIPTFPRHINLRVSSPKH